jgi:hypothetical protein
MLVMSNFFNNMSVLSLHTGGVVGTATTPIIDPNTLEIVGWYCTSRFEQGVKILSATDIREIGPKTIAVNSQEALSDPADLVRLLPIARLRFSLIGKKIVDQSDKKIGNIDDYSLSSGSLSIQKLYTSGKMGFKSAFGSERVIDRVEITEITDKYVKIEDGTVTETVSVKKFAKVFGF